MTSPTPLPPKCPSLITVGSVLSLVMAIASTVLATAVATPSPDRFPGARGAVARNPVVDTVSYNPPPNPSRPKAGTGGGTRGSCGNQTNASPASNAKLTLLAPISHAGQTTSTHPTVAWFMPEEKSYETELRLFEYSDAGQGQEIYQMKGRFAQGIKQFTLPPNEPGLVAGRQYLWKIIVICQAGSPSKNQVADAVLQVAPMPPDLKQALATAKDPLQRSDLYARAGFWYDALAEALKGDPSTKTTPLALLEKLAQIEATAGEPTHQQSDRLKKVIEFVNSPG